MPYTRRRTSGPLGKGQSGLAAEGSPDEEEAKGGCATAGADAAPAVRHQTSQVTNSYSLNSTVQRYEH